MAKHSKNRISEDQSDGDHSSGRHENGAATSPRSQAVAVATNIPGAPPAATKAELPELLVGLPEDRYLNRELSWLDFNARVLALAADESLPLLERAKFLAIFASNLDEFFMVRVAGTQAPATRRDCRSGPPTASPHANNWRSSRVAPRNSPTSTRTCFSTRSALPWGGRRAFQSFDGPTSAADDHGRLSAHFHEQVFPVLTPLAVDHAHPVPLHQRTEPQPRRDGEGLRHPRRTLRSRQGSRQRRPVRASQEHDIFVHHRFFPPDGRTDFGSSGRAVPRNGNRRTSRFPNHTQTPISRSKKIGTRICCRHSNVNWRVVVSVHPFASKLPTT